MYLLAILGIDLTTERSNVPTWTPLCCTARVSHPISECAIRKGFDFAKLISRFYFMNERTQFCAFLSYCLFAWLLVCLFVCLLVCLFLRSCEESIFLPLVMPSTLMYIGSRLKHARLWSLHSETTLCCYRKVSLL